MTLVRAWFTVRTQSDEHVRIEAEPDDIGNAEVTDALRLVYPFDDIEVDDYEVIEE